MKVTLIIIWTLYSVGEVPKTDVHTVPVANVEACTFQMAAEVYHLAKFNRDSIKAKVIVESATCKVETI